MTHVRAAAQAGRFYPAGPEELRATVQAFIAAQPSPERSARAPKAIVAPHAGYIYSGAIAAAAYRLLEPVRDTILRVVLLGPSHRVPLRGVAVSTADAFRTPLGDIPLDKSAVASLLTQPGVISLDQAHESEHSLEVQLPFLQVALRRFSLVPIVCGQAPPEQIARILDSLWGGPETLIVISSDLSHYLDYQSCQILDARTRAAVEALDPTAMGSDQACGRVPLGGLLLAARERHLEVTTLDVRNSGDTAGSKDRVVGYGSWAFWEPQDPGRDLLDLARRQGGLLLDLARQSIRAGAATGKPIGLQLDGFSDELRRSGACFVSLHQDGKLRGCIGSLMAWRPLIADLAENAFKAAFRDPRFPPLSPEEAEKVDISLSLLTPGQPVAFTDEADLMRKLRPRQDGLIIESEGKRAVFLPSVWESLPEPPKFLAHLKAKAGLSPNQPAKGLTARIFQAIEIAAGGQSSQH
jgi:AmmeMemoRadiSam system protein B/AmmeMemoRadiSam system protein A